ncbi:MAG: hypothetical protein WKG00_00640 [Polyangiaceae bacterium]
MVSDSPALTEEEVARHLAALGFSEDVVRRSFSAALEAAPASRTVATVIRNETIRFEGHVELAGMISPDMHQALSDAIDPIMDEPGHARAAGRKLTWVPRLAATDLVVTVHSRRGRTTVAISASMGDRPVVLALLVIILVGGLALSFVPGGIPVGVGSTCAVLVGILLQRRRVRFIEYRAAALAWCLDRVAEAARAAIAGHGYRMRIAAVDATEPSGEPIDELGDIEPATALPMRRQTPSSR